MAQTPSVLFVCLGNICRSPMAEGAMRAAAQEAGLDITIDSAGTGAWHIGSPPDSRAIATAARHGVDITSQIAREVTHRDFQTFDRILALDHQNLANLRKDQPEGATAQLALLMDMVPGREGEAVADPYYGEADNFEATWADISAAAQALVSALTAAQRR